MNKIREVQRLNDRELERVVPPNASWHTDYRDTAYIYIGGLPLELSEGDVITIFSQYGEPVWVRMMRDKETGKSRGFAWLKYEDQRSCDLAVDNLGGATVMGRMLAVDHTRYKKKDDEDEDEFYVGQDKQVNAIDVNGRDESEQEDEGEDRPLLKEEIELAKLMRDQDDDDPMKAYMIEQKKEEVAEAKKALVKTRDKDSRKSRHHKHHRSRRDGSEEDRHRRDRSAEGHRSHRRKEDRRDRHRSTRDASFSPRRDRSTSPRENRRRHRDRSRDYPSRSKPSDPSPSPERRHSHRERRRSSTPPRRRLSPSPDPQRRR